MKNSNHETLLSFDFAGSDGKIKPVTFRNPVKVIAAYTVDEVLPSLKQVEDAVREGFYAAGCLSYESAPAFDPAYKVRDGGLMPLLWFGIYAEPEHNEVTGGGTYKHSEWKPATGRDEYDSAISSIKHAIESGDTYQTNYTIRLKSKFAGDGLAFFEKLKRAQDSNYCAYLDIGDFQVLSASPELFFHLECGTITTRPMKGTVKRGKTLEEDEANAHWLHQSAKNRAENVMIVDLLRNDLGAVAELGTVHVPKLFEIEKYPTVHQMTSTIAAKVSSGTGLVDIFRALFPCGSITGAPKVSTMKIIAELETAPREVYCGAIGYITPGNEAIFNVPIRTVVIDKRTGDATYGVGGGITWDSTAEGEYEEVVAKASLLEVDRPKFELLESLLLKDGTFFLLEEHLNRLARSAVYFNFLFDKDHIRSELEKLADQHRTGNFKVRLTLGKNGGLAAEAQPVSELDEFSHAALAKEPVDKNNPFLYHKTTNRAVYTGFQAKHSDVIDVLLWNQYGELTEFTNGNVVLEIDGELWTPPVSSGLLAGTYREVLLREGKIRERVLTLEDLERSTKVWFMNSVRKWLEVRVKSFGTH